MIRSHDILAGLLIVTALLTATSCQSSAKKTNDVWKQVVPPSEQTSPLHTEPDLWKKAVTQVGQNESAVFSPDGTKLLLISRDRLNHRQRQLYEIDLKTKEEQRLTFQDGEVFEAVYSPFDSSIFYTSTTDEIKEKPILFYPELYKNSWPMTDLYRIQSDRETHDRWTQSTGFDGFPFVHDDPARGQVITISRRIGEHLVLLRSNLKAPQFDTVLDRSGSSVSVFSAHRRLPWRAWVEESKTPGGKTAKIVISRRGLKTSELITKLLDIRHLKMWSEKDKRGLSSEKMPDEDLHLLLTAKKNHDSPRQALWIDFAKSCVTTMDLGPGEITSLDLSPEQDQIAWTLSQGSSAQIFMDTLKRPTAICEPL